MLDRRESNITPSQSKITAANVFMGLILVVNAVSNHPGEPL